MARYFDGVNDTLSISLAGNAQWDLPDDDWTVFIWVTQTSSGS